MREMQKNIPSALKHSNRKIVYQILSVQDGISRADIARMTGISGATVLKITEYLRDKNIVYYDSTESSAALGRKPTPIRFNGSFAYIIAIYMEGTYTSMGIINIQGDTICSREIRVQDAERFIREDFYREIDSLIAESAIDRKKLIGIGVAIPAAVDSASKQVFRAPLFRETQLASLEPILERLGDRYGLPVFVENDVNTAAYGEYRRIYAGRTNDLVYISLGSGLGSGLVINRELWKGQNASAGEIGYMVFDRRRAASADRLGWLESKTNFTALADVFHIDIQNPLDTQTGAKAARYLAKYVSLAILNIYAVLDIKTVVLGGRLTEYLSEHLIREVSREMQETSPYAPELVYGQLPHPGFTGLSCIIADNLLDDILGGE
jgi:predicted NBD/HSP70 family sugar kinase